MNFVWQKLRLLFRFSDLHYSVLIFIISLAFYSVTLRGVLGNPPGYSIKNNLDQATKPFELSPERDRYILTLSLAKDKSFSLSSVLANAAYPDDGYYKGKIYIFFAPGISLFALPLYLLGQLFNLAQVATYFFISIMASLTMVFIFKITRTIFQLPIWASLMAPLVYGFGSTSWSYAITLYQHHVTAFFLISAFYAVWKFKQQQKLSWLWGVLVWTNYALAISVDYPNAMLLLPIMVYFFFSSVTIAFQSWNFTLKLRKAFFLTMIPFIMLMGLHGYYNQTHFGSWKTLSGSLTDYKDIKEGHLLQKKNGQKEITAIQNSKQPVSFFKEENVTNGLYILLISNQRGIFYYSPIFILAILGIFTRLKKISMEIGILIGIICTNLLIYSSFGDPWGGWAFGPRYLIPTMAVLSIFVSIWLAKYGRNLYTRLAAFALFVYSAGIALLGALTTNALPPKVEADFLKMPYTYEWNFRFLRHEASSSFLFNTFFSYHISLMVFYIILYEILLLIALIILFAIPARRSYEDNNIN